MQITSAQYLDIILPNNAYTSSPTIWSEVSQHSSRESTNLNLPSLVLPQTRASVVIEPAEQKEALFCLVK